MRTVRRYAFVFAFGAAAYAFLEMVYRGGTHWTMLPTGGAAFLLLFLLRKKMQPAGLLTRCLAGCLWITVLEFTVGCVVNRWLHLAVWDYSGMPHNVLGQICPAFSGMWFLLCIPGDWLCGQLAAK